MSLMRRVLLGLVAALAAAGRRSSSLVVLAARRARPGHRASPLRSCLLERTDAQLDERPGFVTRRRAGRRPGREGADRLPRGDGSNRLVERQLDGRGLDRPSRRRRQRRRTSCASRLPTRRAARPRCRAACTALDTTARPSACHRAASPSGPTAIAALELPRARHERPRHRRRPSSSRCRSTRPTPPSAGCSSIEAVVDRAPCWSPPGPARLLGHPPRAAPARRHGGHGRRHRRGRPVPPGRAGRRARTEVGRLGAALNGMLHQIEAAFARAPAGVRGPAAPVRRRRLPRAAHAAHLDPGLRRAVPARRDHDQRPSSTTPCAASRARRPAWATLVDDLLLLARLDQGRPLERAARSTSSRWPPTPSPTPARSSPTGPITLDTPTARSWSRATRAGCARWSATCWPTPASTPRRARRSAVRVGAEGDGAVLEVADHGPGIGRRASADRVFERFYRADPARVARTAAGAGLGLSIVAAIAAAHGGRAAVEDTPGGGATFVVRLPLLG